MANPSNKLVLRINRAIAELRAIASELEGKSGPVLPPQSSIDKAAQRICLNCGRKLRDDERARRGQCPGCYQATRIKIREGAVEESDLIRAGAYLPADPGQRSERPRLVDQVIADMQSDFSSLKKAKGRK